MGRGVTKLYRGNEEEGTGEAEKGKSHHIPGLGSKSKLVVGGGSKKEKKGRNR